MGKQNVPHDCRGVDVPLDTKFMYDVNGVRHETRRWQFDKSRTPIDDWTTQDERGEWIPVAMLYLNKPSVVIDGHRYHVNDLVCLDGGIARTITSIYATGSILLDDRVYVWDNELSDRITPYHYPMSDELDRVCDRLFDLSCEGEEVSVSDVVDALGLDMGSTKATVTSESVARFLDTVFFGNRA